MVGRANEETEDMVAEWRSLKKQAKVLLVLITPRHLGLIPRAYFSVRFWLYNQAKTMHTEIPKFQDGNMFHTVSFFKSHI